MVWVGGGGEMKKRMTNKIGKIIYHGPIFGRQSNDSAPATNVGKRRSSSARISAFPGPLWSWHEARTEGEAPSFVKMTDDRIGPGVYLVRFVLGGLIDEVTFRLRHVLRALCTLLFSGTPTALLALDIVSNLVAFVVAYLGVRKTVPDSHTYTSLKDYH